MKTEKLSNKYSLRELAESFVFRPTLVAKQKRQSDKQLTEARKKVQGQVTPKHLLLSRLLQLNYQIEDYLKSDLYDHNLSFGHYLREYVSFLGKKNKEFANDIDIEETELSQILNKHRKPSEKIIIRLEIHSNQTIPAITWFKLLEKEKEYEILTNRAIRRNESKHVKNRLQIG